MLQNKVTGYLADGLPRGPLLEVEELPVHASSHTIHNRGRNQPRFLGMQLSAWSHLEGAAPGRSSQCGTRPCQQRRCHRRGVRGTLAVATLTTLSREQQHGSSSPTGMPPPVPLSDTSSTHIFLRMKLSLSMSLWKKVTWIPLLKAWLTTWAYLSLRMSMSRFVAFWKEVSRTPAVRPLTGDKLPMEMNQAPSEKPSVNNAKHTANGSTTLSLVQL